MPKGQLNSLFWLQEMCSGLGQVSYEDSIHEPCEVVEFMLGVWPSFLESFTWKRRHLADIPLLPLDLITSMWHGCFSSHLRAPEGASLLAQPVPDAWQSTEMAASHRAFNLIMLGLNHSGPHLCKVIISSLFKPLLAAFSVICNQMLHN